MKTLAAAILLFVVLAEARPRFLVIPLEDVHFLPTQHRVARAAWPQELAGPGALPSGPGPAFAIPDAIRAAEEQIAAGR